MYAVPSTWSRSLAPRRCQLGGFGAIAATCEQRGVCGGVRGGATVGLRARQWTSCDRGRGTLRCVDVHVTSSAMRRDNDDVIFSQEDVIDHDQRAIVCSYVVLVMWASHCPSRHRGLHVWKERSEAIDLLKPDAMKGVKCSDRPP